MLSVVCFCIYSIFSAIRMYASVCVCNNSVEGSCIVVCLFIHHIVLTSGHSEYLFDNRE
jgi:hypothetical protein